MQKSFALVILFCFVMMLLTLSGVQAQEDITKKIIQRMEQGDLDGALDIVKNALKQNPENPILLHMLGRIQLKKGQYSESIVSLKTSLESKEKPQWVEAWSYVYLGLCYKTTGENDKAVDYLKKAVDLKTTRKSIEVAARALRDMGEEYGKEALAKFYPRDRNKLEGKPAPEFTLTDIYGLAHQLSEWKGTPIFVHMGPTWCGGCQGEAETVKKLAEKYQYKGVMFIKISLGESEGALTDYLKHYREEKVLGLVDFNFKVEKAFLAYDWPLTVIIDAEGIIRYHNVGAVYHGEDEDMLEILDKITKDTKTDRPGSTTTEAHCEDWVCHLPKEKDSSTRGKWDFLPRAAIDSQGRVWIAFTSNRDGDNNIYLRCCEEKNQGKDLPVTRSISDDYSCDIAIAPDDTIWITWVSNRKGKYDIFVRFYKQGKWSEVIDITKSEDDAFRPRVAIDRKGRIWITYYKWNRQFNRSRDRDIFVRFFNGQSWSEEVEVNPSEPKIDDHTDPSIAIDAEGHTWIAWSYDYHPSILKDPLDANLPSIFIKKVSTDKKEENPFFIGSHTGKQNIIDLFPSLAAGSNGDIWCAWDACFSEINKRFVLVSSMKKDDKSFGTELKISSADVISCTPSLCVDSKGIPHVVWRQHSGEKWSLYGSHFQKGQWTEPALWAKGKGNCLDPVLVSGNEGQLWVIYTDQVAENMEVQAKRLK